MTPRLRSRESLLPPAGGATNSRTSRPSAHGDLMLKRTTGPFWQRYGPAR
jgi:hypothetical protein